MFKNIFKKVFLLFLLTAAITLPFNVKGEEVPYFEIIASEDTSRVLNGVEHRRIVGQMRVGNKITNQVINYTGANIKEDPNVFAVVGDNYLTNGFGMSNLRAQTYNLNMKYLNQARVVSAVNGDFFTIRHEDSSRLGLTVAAHIRDYRTIHDGSRSRIVIGIKDDGSVIFGNPEFKGFHVVVLDDEGSRKLKDIKVDGINRYPEEGEVTVFFSNYEQDIISPEPKMVFNATDVKTIAGDVNSYFAEGSKAYITTEDVDLDYSEFVIMGDPIFEEGLVTKDDIVLVQNVIGGAHEGVRSALGGAPMLIQDGEIIESENKDVHPRTALGVKEDGTLFAVTVDGRQQHINMDGVDYEQLAYLMEYFGAVQAVNLDGGGSTSMLFYDEDKDFYETQNSPSDNPMGLRTVANGLFFLHGNLEPQLPPTPFPDTRPILDTPTNIYFDEQGILRFDHVQNALYYVVTLDGNIRHKIENNFLDLGLGYGEYTFEVKAFGDFDVYKQSKGSDVFNVAVYSDTIYDFIEGLRKYGQRAN